MKTALLLVDIQNDYFPGGRNEAEGSTQASLKARVLLTTFRERQLPVIHIQHISVRPGAAFFIPDTDGVKIHANVEPVEGEPVFQKNYPNSFCNTPLRDYLKEQQIERLVIVGMMTHMCIDSTVRAAFDYGLQCVVAHDACATRALKFGETPISAHHVHQAFLAALGVVFAKVVDTQTVISEMI
jgi:nicotinamidase-related amidase